MSRVLAIDLGGTRLRAAVAPLGDPTALQKLGDWPAPPDLLSFRTEAKRLLGAVDDVSRVGIAVPGLVDGTRSVWIPNLPWLDGVELADVLDGLPVALGNDAQIALLAEVTHGAAKGVADAILLAVGTGIGSAVLADGRIVRGAHGRACSFGWAVADLGDAGDDRSGWLERVAAGRALDRLAADSGHGDGASLIEAARTGDRQALAALDGPAQALGACLASAVALLDPRLILFAGGVASAADILIPRIADAARRHLPPHLHAIDIRPGAFGSGAALVGAAVAGTAGADWRRLG
jgi:predicted NBD/HSP70 family sugar kinase